ncbi:MAG TPA: acyl-CoA dehydrogenase family protein [Burkholderiales bacterium]
MLSEEEQYLRDLARRFTEREILPVRARLDETGEFPVDIIRKAHAAGLLTAHVPEQYGGGGQGLFAICLIAEEIGYGCAGIGTSLLVNYLGTSTILLYGDAAQKHRYMSEYCAKPTLFSFACTEPEAASDMGSIRTTYERRGDTYVISGQKAFITNATYADYFTVFAKRKGEGRALQSLTAFVVPGKAPGVSVGAPIRKLGQKASNTAPVYFDEVVVPAEARLGREGAGFMVATHALARSRLGIGAAGVGLARAALDCAFEYARRRRQFDKPLTDFQAVQCEIAELWERIAAHRALVHYAARRYDRGEAGFRHIYAAKDSCSRMALEVASRSLAILGAYGYTCDFPVEKMLRDARLLEIYEGSSTMQRLMLFNELLRNGTEP